MVAAISQHVGNLHQGEGAAQDERAGQVRLQRMNVIRDRHADFLGKSFGEVGLLDVQISGHVGGGEGLETLGVDVFDGALDGVGVMAHSVSFVLLFQLA